jgi:ribosomal protein L22
MKEKSRDMESSRVAGDSIWRTPGVQSQSPASLQSMGAKKSKSSSEGSRIRLEHRNMASMERALNPRPLARARWQRRMIMRHIRRGRRLTRDEILARTERKHLSRSVFFKGSVKKLMLLARQIAGKPVDEAIMQMRFSKKRLATSVKAQLLQARNEAVVMKGMAQNPRVDMARTLPGAHEEDDPSITPPESHQNPIKTLKKGETANETDMYVAEAWVNRGPYGRKREFRAKGRINMLHHPKTGISILLKEEKTRIREKAEKEAKAIRKRLGKNMWTALPDRPVTNQHQHILW